MNDKEQERGGNNNNNNNNNNNTSSSSSRNLRMMRDFATSVAMRTFIISAAECAPTTSSTNNDMNNNNENKSKQMSSMASRLPFVGRGNTNNTNDTNDSNKNTNNGTAFDPEALERGAKALREINKSPYAKNVIDLSGKQEQTKQSEARAEEARMQAIAAQHATEREKVMWEQQRKLETQRAEQNAQ
jgi:hypothetical protein